MDQIIIFFLALVRGVFIESPTFSGSHTYTDLIWRKRNLQRQDHLSVSVRDKEIKNEIIFPEYRNIIFPDN